VVLASIMMPSSAMIRSGMAAPPSDG